ncbi:unnamed protein product [Rhizophagus irregularis]|nr:unnamed protein product [Rhizophagus irregularis]
MAKLRADINYNRQLNDNDLNNDQGSIDLKENLNSQFNDHLNEWLEELQQEEDDEYDGEHDEYSESEKDFSDINVEDIEHPAENIDAKWKLEFMFKIICVILLMYNFLL